MTRAYATIANDGKRVDGAIMGDVPRVVQEVRFRKSGKSRKNEPVAEAVLTAGEAETLTSILSDVVGAGHGSARAALGSPGGRQDGHHRQLRRRLVRRLHARARGRGLGRLPQRAQADGDRVRRRARLGRHVARADLEGVHDARAASRRGAASRSRPRRTSRPTTCAWSTAAAAGDSTTGTAPGRASSRTSPAGCRRRRRPATRTRSRCRSWSAAPSTRRASHWRRSRSQRTSSTSRRSPRTRPGLVVKQKPRGRLPLGERRRPALGLGRARTASSRTSSGRACRTPASAAASSSSRCASATATGRPASVLEQSLEPGVAVRPGLPITLLVGRDAARPARARLDVAPRLLDRLRDPDPRCPLDRDRRRRRHERERRLGQVRPVVRARQAERLRQAAGAGAQQARRRRALAARASRRARAVGSSARRSTAAPRPASSQTTFAHQWSPYER